MWAKTREQVELSIILARLTHTLMTTYPSRQIAVIRLTDCESTDRLAIDGREETVVPGGIAEDVALLKYSLPLAGYKPNSRVAFTNVSGTVTARVSDPAL